MAVRFQTTTPKKLLLAYKAAIDAGQVKTWSYDAEGDFTHSAQQWTGKAWLRPKVFVKQELVFYILSPREVELTSAVYAVYHGRFVESVVHHCDSLFSEARVSAMPESGDVTS